MKTILQLVIVFTLIYFFSSKNATTNQFSFEKDLVDDNNYSSLKKNIFYIKGLGNISSYKLQEIANEIENFYGFSTIIQTNIEINENMFIKNTNEILNATTCLEILDNSAKKVIYVTDKKLWSSGDYVNGLAYQNGNTVVVTTDAINLLETTRHEIGHTFGLDHCNNITCVMASRNDKYEIGKFCNKCKNFFKNKFNLK